MGRGRVMEAPLNFFVSTGYRRLKDLHVPAGFRFSWTTSDPLIAR